MTARPSSELISLVGVATWLKNCFAGLKSVTTFFESCEYGFLRYVVELMRPSGNLFRAIICLPRLLVLSGVVYLER